MVRGCDVEGLLGSMVLRSWYCCRLRVRQLGTIVTASTLCLSLVSSPLHAAQYGIASVYKHGTRTANGERFRPGDLTGAHRTLAFNTFVRVTNLKNGKAVVVRINDRGPFIRGRIIDLTPRGARAIGFSGLARVKVERIIR